MYGTYPVLEALTPWFPVRELLSDYADFSWSSVEIGEPLELDDRLRATAFLTGPKAHTGRSMGHQPVGGDDGSARILAALPAKRRIYTHINNTNPMLDEESRERRWLADLGIEIGRAGLAVEV